MSKALGGGLSILGWPADTGRLAGLREQRMLLRALRDDVGLARGQVLGADLAASWRSAAQRKYAERLAELAAELEDAYRQLDVALEAVRASIARLASPE